ncbi:MAG: hypothetical protein PUI48_01255 [Oscillospiraceae bacterium]|nr:hypothetical protein [Oscillospiraceae bacterium]MDY6209047.1 hypothetical protein [Oscillospiraceae bacterium]
MGNFYENETECEKCISLFHTSSGKKKQLYLEEVCRFKTKAADKFWQDRITDERFLPYIMMCRSDEFSDYCAGRLDDFLDRAMEGMEYRDAVNELYFLLHACLFKESDKMTDIYAKAARNYKKILKMGLSWSGDIISQTGQPPFLYARYLAEREQNCENTFFTALTDIIILTMANAIETDGEYETFTGKVKELYELYPDVFAEAGFFAYFIKDTSAAYDKFSYLLEDPATYPRIFWVLDGLSWENNGYVQGSPTYFAGPDNERRHFSLVINDIDIRWYKFFAEKALGDVKGFTTEDPFFYSVYLRSFSVRMIELIAPENEETMEYSRRYFRESAVLGGNPADFAGLLQCGCIKDVDDLTELCLDIAKQICSGRQRYCYHILFHFFREFSGEDRLAAAGKTAEYLSENEHSERLAAQRNVFFEQYDAFVHDEQSFFDGE